MNTIDSLKAENARLKLMLDEQRESIKRLTGEIKSHEAKEQSISSAIPFAVERSNQWDNSMRKLYELGIQRSRLLYARMERVLNELYIKYPELKKESKLKDMADRFKSIAEGNDVSKSFSENKNSVSEDPIRKLLNNIISYIDDKKETKTMTRRPGVYSAFDAVNNAYASSQPTSGFNINEALNPTEDLEEILKSFNLKRNIK